MSRIPIMALAFCAILAAPATLAYHGSGSPSCCHDCPVYTQQAPIADGYALDWNEQGQFLLTVTAQEDPVVFWTGPHTFYAAYDEPDAAVKDPLGDSLFSIWTYSETNGIPGLQRVDTACWHSEYPEGDTLDPF